MISVSDAGYDGSLQHHAISPRRNAFTALCAMRVGSGMRYAPRVRIASSMLSSTVMRCPGETIIGLHFVFVRTFPPMISPSESYKYEYARASGAGSSPFPYKTLFANPIEGISRTIPRCVAMPKRRGCAMPCPSTQSTSGLVFSFSNALRSAGISRNERKPGIYGNVVVNFANADSISRISGNDKTTIPAKRSFENRFIETSTPATVFGGFSNFSSRISERSFR
jgi:hypothetical protein